MEKYLSKRLQINEIKQVALSLDTQGKIDKMIELIHNNDSRISSNAAWILTHVPDTQLHQIQQHLNILIETAINASNVTVRRLTLTTIERLTIREDDLRTDFLDFCLERMVSPQETPGVRSLCIKLAYRLCSFYPELMDEFLHTLSLVTSTDCAKSIKAVCKKYKKMEQ